MNESSFLTKRGVCPIDTVSLLRRQEHQEAVLCRIGWLGKCDSVARIVRG